MKKLSQWIVLMISTVLCLGAFAACSSGESFEKDGLDAVRQHLESNHNYTVMYNDMEYRVNSDCVVYVSDSLYQAYVYNGQDGGKVSYRMFDYLEKFDSVMSSGDTLDGTKDDFYLKLGYAKALYLDWEYASGEYVYSDSTLTIDGNKITVDIGSNTAKSDAIRQTEYVFSEFGTTSFSVPSALQKAIDSVLGA